MAKLMCEICGGSLVMNMNNISECENCGMKYAKEKVAQMVKIDGVVEVTTGSAEKERLLENAETYLSLEKYTEAYELCRRITNEYPGDYRSWYLCFKSVVYALANNVRLSFSKSDIGILEEADSNLKTAIKLSKNKDDFGKEAIAFWFAVLYEGNTDLRTLYSFRDGQSCSENHVVSIFLKKVDAQFSLLVNELNSCQNKKDVCVKLGFTSRYDEPITKRINSFSMNNCWITADGIIVEKEFDGISFWGSKSKYRPVEKEKKDVYYLPVNSFNELQELIKAVSNLTNK